METDYPHYPHYPHFWVCPQQKKRSIAIKKVCVIIHFALDKKKV